MGSMYDDYDLLLEAPNATEAALAQELLADAGIPSLLHGRDRDVAELGVATHGRLTSPDLFVPKGTRARARAVLDASWTTERLADDAAVGEVPSEEQPGAARLRAGTQSTLLVWLVVGAAALVALAFYVKHAWSVDRLE